MGTYLGSVGDRIEIIHERDDVLDGYTLEDRYTGTVTEVDADGFDVILDDPAGAVETITAAEQEWPLTFGRTVIHVTAEVA